MRRCQHLPPFCVDLLFLFNLQLFTSVGSSRGIYQSEAISIDGNMNDWILPLRFSNPDYTMHYSVTNDDKNIYICLYLKKSGIYQKGC